MALYDIVMVLYYYTMIHGENFSLHLSQNLL